MDDIYLSEKHGKNKKKTKNSRPWSDFFFCLLYKSLTLFSFLAIDFVLFANAGSYQIFETPQMLMPEFYYIISALFVLSFIIIYVFSFSVFFQNVILVMVFIGVSIAFLNQFALFDKGAMLYGVISGYLGDNMGLIFTDNSHYIVIGGLAFILFLVLSFASRITLVYFTGILLLVLAAICTATYFSARYGNDAYRVSVDKTHPLIENSDAKRFVYIAFPDFGSIANIKTDDSDKLLNNATKEIMQKTRENVLGFFEQNRFMIYPNAYVVETDPFLNMAQNLNPSTRPDDIETNLLNKISLTSMWNFDNLSNQYIYMKNTQLFYSFRKAKYNVSVYQSRGVELCSQQEYVSRCIRKQNLPVDMNNLKISVWQKTMLLLAQWIESSKLFNDFSFLYSNLRPFFNIKEIPLLSYSTDNFYVINSLNTLDILAQDIIKDKTNYAYFVFVDLPSDMYIYDEFCQIKPIEKWQYKNDRPWINQLDKNLKIQSYYQQMNCLFGKLEDFMRKLQDSGIDKKSVVVLHGLSGHVDMPRPQETAYVADFKDNTQVMLAIRDPLKKESEIHDDACFSADLLRSYLFKSPKCEELGEINMHANPKNQLLEILKNNVISKDEMQQSKKAFLLWFDEWKKRNQNAAISLSPLEKDKHPQLGSKIADKILNGKPAIIEDDKKLKDEIKAFSDAVNDEKDNVTPEVSVKIIEKNKTKEVVNKPKEKIKEKLVAPVTAEEEAAPETEVMQDEVKDNIDENSKQ